jgi:hypothetical protein
VGKISEYHKVDVVDALREPTVEGRELQSDEEEGKR